MTIGLLAALCAQASSRGRSGSSPMPKTPTWRSARRSWPSIAKSTRTVLVDAFARARQRGAHISELSTDSRTGALGLYEHVGMVVTQTWRHWMTDL